MTKEKLLFVTEGGNDCDNGFTYILELAKTLNAGISMLMVYHEKIIETCEDAMSAVAFAEAGDLNTVKELMSSQQKNIKDTAENKIREMTEKCLEDSVPFTYQIAAGDAVTSIRDFLKNRPEIDMVLLSPNLSAGKKCFDLKKLIKNITKPIVTISRPVEAGA